MASLHKTAQLETGETVFYREAGRPEDPTILLLHGFPSSSHQYRNLIPRLAAASYHVLAPDLPGFGFTTTPKDYVYTFDNLAESIARWLKAIPNSPKKYALYIFDYGAPTGLRLALKDPGSVTAIVSQNGNAYLEGLGPAWAGIKAYWATGNKQERDAILPAFSYEGLRSQYVDGTPDNRLADLAPETWTLDHALIQRPGNIDIQLDLFYDYQKNLELYPAFQEYFRKSQVPLLAIWGKNDAFFTPPGAEAFAKDIETAVVKFLDAGHFALESHTEDIAQEMLSFLNKSWWA